jgi:hypothetical protein
LRDPHRVLTRIGAALGGGEAAQAEDIEDGGAFVNASEGDDEVAAAFGRGAATCAFGDI